MIDLHLHSNRSDGTNSPSQLVNIAVNSKYKIKAIALTDHDTIDGIEEFLPFAEDKYIIAIPGIELSIKDQPERDIRDVHIIGLNINHKSSVLNKTLNKQLKGRIDQKISICDRLRNEFGYDITFNEVKNYAKGNSIGRPHIVDILIRNNPEIINYHSKTQLFEMISVGGLAHVNRKFELTLEEAIEIIESAAGIPILAHPGVYEVKNRCRFIELCVELGIKGIEIEYTYEKNRPFSGTPQARWAQDTCPKYYEKLSERYGLVKSGGSDYHGGKKGIEIGEANVPDVYLKNFI